MTIRENLGPWRKLAEGDYGSAAVEMAVVASVFFMALLGAMKVCLAVYTYHFVSEAAREATRYAAVHGSSSGDEVDTADIQKYVRSLGYPAIASSLLTASTSWSGFPAGTVCTPSANCHNPENMVTITVSYPFPLTVPFWKTTTWTVTSTAASVISQ